MIHLRFHPGMTQPREIRRLASEFVDIVESHGLMSFGSKVFVDMMPVPVTSGGLGIAILPQKGCDDYYLQVAAVDWKLSAFGRSEVARLKLVPEEGPWPQRFIKNLSHELAHATGVDQEAAAYKRGDAVLRAACARSATLRAVMRSEK